VIEIVDSEEKLSRSLAQRGPSGRPDECPLLREQPISIFYSI